MIETETSVTSSHIARRGWCGHNRMNQVRGSLRTLRGKDVLSFLISISRLDPPGVYWKGDFGDLTGHGYRRGIISTALFVCSSLCLIYSPCRRLKIELWEKLDEMFHRGALVFKFKGAVCTGEAIAHNGILDEKFRRTTITSERTKRWRYQGLDFQDIGWIVHFLKPFRSSAHRAVYTLFKIQVITFLLQ